MEELNRILHDLDQGNVNVKTAKRQIFQLFELENKPCTIHGVGGSFTKDAVSGLLPSKDEVVGKGFNNANGSEYNSRVQ